MDNEYALSVTDENLAALVCDAKFQQLEGRFARFCPFEAVGMVSAEIRHCNFLGYMLNPFKPHGFDAVLLGAFLERTLARDTVLGLDLATLKDAEVRREWRNIDLLILLPKARQIVVVELKIDASQSVDQLERYRAIVETSWPAALGWKYTYLFMTKHDEMPNDAMWTEFKLHDLINAFGDIATAEEYRHAPALDTLGSYISMMRKHHLGDKELEQRASELWAKHGDALSFLMDRRPDPLREIFDQVRADGAFVSDISPAGVTVIPDKHGKRILRYAFQAWDELTAFRTAREWTSTGRLILLEIKLEDSGIRAYLMIGPGLTSDRDAYASALAPGIRAKYVRAAEEELLALNSEVELSYEDLIARIASFVQRVFSQFDPIARSVSTIRSEQT